MKYVVPAMTPACCTVKVPPPLLITENATGVCEAVKTDAIPGLSESIPDYVAKGLGSWKYKATGLQSDDDSGDRPRWSDVFEKSDYRRFHDAVKEHRFVITQDILPTRGLRIA